MPEIEFSTSLSIGSLLIRITAACILGLILGFDREVRNRPAGIRTYMMISLASCLFVLIAIEMIYALGDDDDITQMDPIRAIQAITAGVAFLGAGTIIQSRGSVKGLTTGAGMWLAGAIGLACGTGLLGIAVLGTVLALVILIPLRMLETHWFDKKPVEAYSGSDDETDLE